MTAAPPAQKETVASPEKLLERLSHVDLLRALPPEEIHSILPLISSCRFSSGEVIFRQGETGDALYLVQKGGVTLKVDGDRELASLGPGGVFGEMALLSGEPRTATALAATDVELLRLGREEFAQAVTASPKLEAALREVAGRRQAGRAPEAGDSLRRGAWRGTALRALAARRRRLEPWQAVMALGLALWVAIFLNEQQEWLAGDAYEVWVALVRLLAGLTILQGACEAFVQAVERLGARFHWEGFISGTVGSMVATLPEFVVIGFLVQVQPLAAFVTALVTIYNNALAFSVYSFFLPKDQKGRYLMPASLSKAGAEILIAGSGVALIVGGMMLVLRAETFKTQLTGLDLLVLATVLLAVYAYYTFVLLRYYAEGDEESHPAHPPDPAALGHDTSWKGIALMFGLGITGSYFGGEAIGGFADTALNSFGLPTIPTASALAFFAGISEYIIVWKAHRRGELGIALSNAFGGMTQVMFLLLPAGLLTIALLGLLTGNPVYSIPINAPTTLLMLLLFPLFYVLLQYIQEDHTLSNLDAAAMTGIYVLLLYFLFTASGS